MALITLDDLLGCLEMRELRPGVWTGPSLDMDYPRVFGGQLLAQAVALGAATTEGKTVKSLSCLFPREARRTEPLEFEVEETQTGRTFAVRRIRASQQHRTVFVALLSMHVPESGTPPDLEHQDPAPEAAQPGEAVEVDLNMIPWATRVVDGTDLRDKQRGPADYAFWTRVSDRRLPDDSTVHQALLAHATDLTVVGTVLRPVEGISQADAGHRLHTAVTSHTMWFHRPFRIDEWCLVAQHSPTLAGGRGFGHGHAYDAGGALVASFGQECMIRPIASG
ncbi:MAG: thioesterase family protein [Acidimicrobiaceae bacterium]|nr:thioesterase family protein [Acidimicrobiaceae bacterium]